MSIKSNAAAWLAAGAALSSTPALADCKFVKVGELAVDTQHGPPTVEIKANGRTGRLIVDTGAFASSLTARGAEKLDVKRGFESNVVVITKRSEERASIATLEDAVLGGGFGLGRFQVYVSPARPDDTDSDIVGRLGLDVLGAADVEFDLANGRVALFKTDDCGKLPLAYWGKAFSVADTRRPAPDWPRLITTVKLNGRSFRAQIQSGAGFSAIDKVSAGVAGVAPDGAGVRKVEGVSYGAGDVWTGTFQTFAVGEELINNVTLAFWDLYGGVKIKETHSRIRQRMEDMPQVILGGDFLRAHRVLIANSQGKMYFTYNGGPVFARPTAP